jgi:exonuclease V
VVELSDIPLKKFAKRGLSVTKISNQFWCEKQVELSFLHPRELTEEMAIGRSRHDELHREVAELIQVRATSEVDFMGIRLHNMFVGLRRLLQEKLTREVPIMGFFSNLGVPVIGQIDELLVEKGRTRIIDHKTRRTDSMPSAAQTRVAEFQLMTYHELFRRFRAEPLHLREVLKFHGLNERSRITDELLAQLEPNQYPAERNITKLGRMVVRAAKTIPNLSKDLEVIYESQQTKKIIGSHRFQFSEKAWKQDLQFASQYWLGNRAAKPVDEANRWKCAFCEFKEKAICPVWAE